MKTLISRLAILFIFGAVMILPAGFGGSTANADDDDDDGKKIFRLGVVVEEGGFVNFNIVDGIPVGATGDMHTIKRGNFVGSFATTIQPGFSFSTFAQALGALLDPDNTSGSIVIESVNADFHFESGTIADNHGAFIARTGEDPKFCPVKNPDCPNVVVIVGSTTGNIDGIRSTGRFAGRTGTVSLYLKFEINPTFATPPIYHQGHFVFQFDPLPFSDD